MKHSTRYSVAACVVLAASGCSVHHQALDDSQRYLRIGNVYQAFQTLEEARPESFDLEYEREYQRVRLLYLLESGREAVYEERELEGIEFFSRALALDPGNEEAAEWIRRARAKLALEATERGDTFRYTGQLEEALKSYAEAQEHVPGYQPAEEGKHVVSELFDARHAKAEYAVRTGERNLEEQRNPEALQRGIVAQDEDPLVPGGEELVAKSTLRLNEDKLALAIQAQELGNYAAALRMLEQVKKQEPDTNGIDERIQAMALEVEAGKLRIDGEMALARAIDNPLTTEDEVEIQLDKAEAAIREAYDKSSWERPELTEILISIREKRFARRYQRAADLIRASRHHAALDVYRSIDAQARNGYKDVKARINILEEEIALAQEAYDKGEAAQASGDLEAALGFFREANLYARGFLDVDERMRQLRTKLDAGAVEQDPPVETGEVGTDVQDASVDGGSAGVRTVDVETGLREPNVPTPDVSEPHLDVPRVDEPKGATPGVETPDVEEPHLDVPRVDEPKGTTPDVDEPKVEEPHMEKPRVQTPGVQTPGVQTPGGQAPGVQTPGGQAPGVQTPGVQTPGGGGSNGD